MNLHWKLPLCVDPMGLAIRDAEGHKVCDIRGWGRLTGRGGGLALGEDEAIAIQKARGKAICDAVNGVQPPEDRP